MDKKESENILDGYAELKKLVENTKARKRYTPTLRSMIEADFEAIVYAHNQGCIWADIWDAYRRERGIESSNVSLITTFRFVSAHRDKVLHDQLVREAKRIRVVEGRQSAACVI